MSVRSEPNCLAGKGCVVVQGRGRQKNRAKPVGDMLSSHHICPSDGHRPQASPSTQ